MNFKTRSIASKNLLGTLAVSASLLALLPARADVIVAFSQPFSMFVNGPNGENITLTTQISLGNFTGFGNEFLYQYRVLVNAGSARVDGLNLWTPSAAVFNAGGNVSQAAVNMATTGAAANGGAALAGNNKIASQQDPGGAGPAGSSIPATAGGAAPFNNIPGFIPNNGFSTTGNGISYIFATPPGNLNNSFNFNTTAIGGFAPTGQNTVGLNWGFADWSNGDGNSLIRWFAVNPLVDGLVPGQSMVFNAFSPFGPVSGGAFPDPDASEVFVNFDELPPGGGPDVSSDVALDPVNAAPEPSTWSLLFVSLLGGGMLLRRKSVRA